MYNIQHIPYCFTKYTNYHDAIYYDLCNTLDDIIKKNYKFYAAQLIFAAHIFF